MLINFCSELLEPKYQESIEWSKWHIFWVDERVVPLDHEDSNYKLAFDGFLSKVFFLLLIYQTIFVFLLVKRTIYLKIP